MEKKFSNILKKIPNNLTQIEQARWLYIELGKHFKYDMNVFYLPSEKLGETYNKKVDVDREYFEKTLCKTINEIYIELLKRLKIKSELKTFDGDYEYNHVGTVIKFDDGLEIFTDLTVDLYRIQNGLKTNNYGYSSPEGVYDILSRIEMKKIDDKIGYTYLGLYMNDFIEIIAEEMKNQEFVEKYLPKNYGEGHVVADKFEFMLKQIPFEKLGYVEARNFLMYLIDTVFTDCEKQKIKQYDLYRELENDEREFINCIAINEQKIKFFIQEENKNIQKVDKEKMNEMFEKGWKNRHKKEILNLEEVEL